MVDHGARARERGAPWRASLYPAGFDERALANKGYAEPTPVQAAVYAPVVAGTGTRTLGDARSSGPGVAPAETFSVTITVK